MRAIRRLNNNAVVCMDSTGREVIALGKGLGFGNIPRELKLSEVERTFYDLDEGGVNVMNDLPVDVVMFAAKIIDIAVGELSYELSPNAVLLLADHLNFALERVRKNIRVKMPLAYDVKQLYPLEYKIGKYAVDKARKEFQVGLANDEAVGIAMNLINAKKTPSDRPDPEAGFDQMLEEVTEIVEEHFHVMVDRESFNFTRYATHIQYLFQRLRQHTAIDSENLKMYKDLREEFPDIAACPMDSMKPDYDPFETLKKAVAGLQLGVPGVFVCHPGYLDDFILNNSSLTVNRTREVAMLCDPAVKAWLEDQGVELITYDDV